MKWARLLLLTACLLFLASMPMASAAQTNPDNPPRALSNSSDFIESLMPSINSQGIERKYTKYPLWNYTMDADSAWYDPVTPAIMFLLNLGFVIQALFVRVSLSLFEQAYTLDLLNSIGDYIQTFVSSFKRALWDPLAGILLSLSGLVILFNAGISYRRSKSVQQLLVTILVLGISVMMFAYPKQVIVKLNEISRDVSATVLSSTMPLMNNQVSTINQGVVVAGNQLWEQQILYPWYLMQFGSISDGKTNEAKFLPYAKGSDIRDDNRDDQISAGNWLMEEKGIFARFILLCMANIWNSISIAFVFVISVLVLATQLAPLVMICLCPAVLVLALIPYFGMTIIYRWSEQVLGAMFYKVALSIFLSIFIISSHVFYAIFDQFYMLQLIVQMVLMIMIFLYRKKIMGIFTSIPKGAQATGQAISAPADIKGQLGRAAQVAGSLALGAAGMAATGGLSGGIMAATKSGSMLHKGAMIAGRLTEQKKDRAIQPHAQRLLYQRFLEQKEAADAAAYQTKTPPRYNAFVQSTMERMDRGLPLFTKQQQDAVAAEMKDIRAQGGNIQRMFLATGTEAKSPVAYKQAQDRHRQRVQRHHEHFSRARQRRLDVISIYEGSKRGPLPEEGQVEDPYYYDPDNPALRAVAPSVRNKSGVISRHDSSTDEKTDRTPAGRVKPIVVHRKSDSARPGNDGSARNRIRFSNTAAGNDRPRLTARRRVVQQPANRFGGIELQGERSLLSDSVPSFRQSLADSGFEGIVTNRVAALNVSRKQDAAAAPARRIRMETGSSEATTNRVKLPSHVSRLVKSKAGPVRTMIEPAVRVTNEQVTNGGISGNVVSRLNPTIHSPSTSERANVRNASLEIRSSGRVNELGGIKLPAEVGRVPKAMNVRTQNQRIQVETGSSEAMMNRVKLPTNVSRLVKRKNGMMHTAVESTVNVSTEQTTTSGMKHVASRTRPVVSQASSIRRADQEQQIYELMNRATRNGDREQLHRLIDKLDQVQGVSQAVQVHTDAPPMAIKRPTETSTLTHHVTTHQQVDIKKPHEVKAELVSRGSTRVQYDESFAIQIRHEHEQSGSSATQFVERINEAQTRAYREMVTSKREALHSEDPKVQERAEQKRNEYLTIRKKHDAAKEILHEKISRERIANYKKSARLDDEE